MDLQEKLADMRRRIEMEEGSLSTWTKPGCGAVNITRVRTTQYLLRSLMADLTRLMVDLEKD